MAIFELLCVLVAIGLFDSAQSFYPVMIGGIILLVIVGFVRSEYRGRLFQSTKLDWPLGVFLLSGVISLWFSYDIWISLAKLHLILGSIALFYVLNQASFQTRFYFATGLVFLAAVVTLYLIIQPDVLIGLGANKNFVSEYASAYLNRFFLQLNLDEAYRFEADGMLEVALFIGVGLLAGARQASLPLEILSRKEKANKRRSLMVTMLALVLGVIILGLFLTGSRGTWLTIGLIGLGWYVSNLERTRRFRVFDIIAGVTIAGSLLILLMDLNGPIDGIFSLGQEDYSRLTLYRGASQLVQDYLFTGAGLGTFPMLYSAYILGIDVVFLNHPHNLYLAVWLEQGPIGLVALLWLGLAFFRAYRDRQQNGSVHSRPGGSQAENLLAKASCWALAAIFLHGLVDSVHYNSPYLPLIFVALGLGGFLSDRVTPKHVIRAFWPKPTLNLDLVAYGILLFGLLLWGSTPILASWYANLGAVAQAKIELDNQWRSGTPSKVRALADLSQPVMLFERALQLAPSNVTARERLELIKVATSQSSEHSARRR